MSVVGMPRSCSLCQAAVRFFDSQHSGPRICADCCGHSQCKGWTYYPIEMRERWEEAEKDGEPWWLDAFKCGMDRVFRNGRGDDPELTGEM